MRPSKTSSLFNTKSNIAFFSGHTTFQLPINSMLTVSGIRLDVVLKTLYISSLPVSQIDFRNKYIKIFK